MRKKTSNPISLFSFQDIITCLTGIMIVVVLVILLQLVETVSRAMAEHEKHPEFQIMREKLAELKKQRQILEKELAEAKKNKDKPAPILLASEAEISFMIKQESEKIRHIKRQLIELNKVLHKLIDQISKQEYTIAMLRKQKKELEAKNDDLKKASMKVAMLRNRKKAIQSEIDKKRKMLSFEFSGSYGRTPVLIEVTSWGFRAKIHPDGEVVTFGARGQNYSPVASLSKLRQWLASQTSNVYPVLLFRRDSLRFHNDIYTFFRSAGVGRELLDDGEECF